ncbi:cilia- and flagella-associated protein 410-like [Drosophila elegans]|uniref:cilia- and flagella-associated protein 410-like n=1 Tax=Drosophila elegans TaxID=30023 RepID=UPI0007E857D3|nr:cilia- and flagella-associated protein 410-like [Drosophila elegans]
MNRLTQHVVEGKSRCHDYRHAVKLNVWNSELDDIKICLDMPYLEVLVLNANNIDTLSSLQNCHRLKELYIRKNKIASFEELNFLANARCLTLLCLEDNPCTVEAGSNYRACVLRKLPQLKILDGVEVCELELQAALRHEAYPVQKKVSKARVAVSAPSTCDTKMNNCRERREREPQKEPQKEPPKELQPVKEQVRQDVSGAMPAMLAKSEGPVQNLNLVPSSIHPSLAVIVAQQRRLKLNRNLLNASLSLIREMDAPTLKALSQAIQQLILNKS